MVYAGIVTWPGIESSMEESVAPLSAWSQRDRDGLKLAMAALGHSQRACAERLRELGSTGANQSTVSKWISGDIARPQMKTVLAVRSYVEEAFPAGLPRSSQPELLDDPLAQAQQFDDTVRGITNEPLLGPRQGDLIDAVTVRLREGPAMSDSDERALNEQRRILGLG